MNFCTLQVSGIKPEVSHKAFLQSYTITADPKYYKRYEKRLNDFFQKKLSQNITQNHLPHSLEKSFSIDFKSDGIHFQSNSKDALKYEFGAGSSPPRKFIEPALVETANEVSNIMITDAINLYNQYSRFV